MSFSTTSSEPIRRPMRGYAIAVIVVATAWLAATMAANILIDPEEVFGTNLIGIHLNPNTRYHAFRDYEAAPAGHDAVLFGSSRGNAFDRTLMAELLGVQKVANFSVAFGLLTDHLPTLEFLLRDQAARGGRLKAVFLVLDADFFGKEPWTNINIGSFLPPPIGRESRFRFWWRYLTAFQFKIWLNDLRVAHSRSVARLGPDGLRSRVVQAGLVPVRPLGPLTRQVTTVAETEETSAPEIRADLEHQLDLLARFVALCRQHDLRLAIAFSPLNRQNVRDDQAPDAARIVETVARVTPVWDFDRPAWLSDRPDLWMDFSHYSPEVATMMMQRILGATTSGPADFGQLKGR
jgi:hypothetical protein